MIILIVAYQKAQASVSTPVGCFSPKIHFLAHFAKKVSLGEKPTERETDKPERLPGTYLISK